jgi:PHD/YefM family antitoxin component YafN of YafNO toxin-antitoxin module
VRLLVAVKVTNEVCDSLLDSVNNADNDIVVVAHDVDDALLDDVAEFEFEADKVEPTDCEE